MNRTLSCSVAGIDHLVTTDAPLPGWLKTLTDDLSKRDVELLTLVA